MQFRAVIILTTILVLVPISSSGSSQEASFVSRVSSSVWTLLDSYLVRNRRPTDNDMQELLARMTKVTRGEPLSDDALNRTLECARNPKDGFNMLLGRTSGYTWMFCTQIIAELDHQAEQKRLVEVVRLLRQTLADQNARITALEQEVRNKQPSAK